MHKNTYKNTIRVNKYTKMLKVRVKESVLRMNFYEVKLNFYAIKSKIELHIL